MQSRNRMKIMARSRRGLSLCPCCDDAYTQYCVQPTVADLPPAAPDKNIPIGFSTSIWCLL